MYWAIHLEPQVFASELEGMMSALAGDVVLDLERVGETAERIKKVVAERGQSGDGQHTQRAIGRKRYGQPRMGVMYFCQIGGPVEAEGKKIQPVGVKDPLVLQSKKLTAVGRLSGKAGDQGAEIRILRVAVVNDVPGEHRVGASKTIIYAPHTAVLPG